MGQPGRDALGETLRRMRTALMKRVESPEVKRALAKIGLSTGELAADQNLLAVERWLRAETGGPVAVAAFDASIRLATLRQQWDAALIREQLKTRLEQFRKKGVAYLAVTRLDIYADDHNYLFGQAEGDLGVFSYARYRAEFFGETPLRSRLTTRVLKQALASAGHAFGVERCTDPGCARAFCISLEEHDAKSDVLCAACKAGFERAFRAAR